MSYNTIDAAKLLASFAPPTEDEKRAFRLEQICKMSAAQSLPVVTRSFHISGSLPCQN